MFKLLNTKTICNFSIQSADDFNKWNNQLLNYNLNSFQHRILLRLSTFVYKILHENNSPLNLSCQFVFNYTLDKKYSLRNLNHLHIPAIGTCNEYGIKQFIYFFSKFINEIMIIENLELNFQIFKSITKNNLDNLFLKFIKVFVSFDLKFKPLYIKHKTKLSI